MNPKARDCTDRALAAAELMVDETDPEAARLLMEMAEAWLKQAHEAMEMEPAPEDAD
jgi:hypothetical protein